MSAPRGKDRRPTEAPTEELRPVDAAPEFRSEHRCRATPVGFSVENVPPSGWRIRLGSVLLGRRQGLSIGPVSYCCFCGLELEGAR